MCLLRPTFISQGDITTVDLDMLAKHGVKGIILDLDSTLMAPRSGYIDERVTQWIASAEKKFKLAVVSNNKNTKYIENAAACLPMPVIGKASKPSRKILFSVLNQLQLNADEVVLIGDRPLTDILAGKRAGMKTYLVSPLSTMQESALVRFVRKLERLVIKS